MKLIALDIHGFKSFPESTHIQFHEGITAIVGPNGSGKSNIADALLWVLGEQSVKSLRGGKMQDLIFSGTEHRKAQAYAEVILTLDNSDHELNIDYETVAIKRRLYRTGESEYAINQKNCRLKDIVDLLLDSGLGKNGYSLVGQGRIDELLSARYEDRRAIFDEAAGISKYRKRKEEAEQKLRYTEDNLLRIQDIQREISAQMQTLSKQAEVATTYIQLHDELTSLDLDRIYHELSAYNEKSVSLQDDIDVLSQQIATEEKAKAELLASNSLLEDQKAEIQTALDLVRSENEQLAFHVAELKQNLELLNLNRSKFAQSHNEKEQAILDFAKEIASLEEKEAAEQANKENVNAEIASLSSELSKWQNEFGSFLKHSSEAENKWQLAQTKLNNEQTAYWQENVKIADLQAKQAAVKSQLSVQAVNCADLAKELKQLEKEYTEKTEQLTKTENKEASARTELNNIIASYNQLKEALKIEAKDVSDEEAKLNTLLYREHGLKQACANYEGFNQSVRQLLTYIRRQSLYSQEQVCGSLADLITIPANYAYAIDSVLGQSIQNIVTDTAQTASDLINLLKQKRFGRANFLPLDNLRTRKIDEHDLLRFQKLAGFKGIAADLVSCEAKYQIAVDYRLGRIVVADNLSTARELANLCDRRYLIVTLDGDQISVGGAMSGGEKQKNSASLLLITRQQEIKALAKEIAQQSKLLQNKQASYQANMQKFSDSELALTKQKQICDDYHVQTLTKKQALEQLVQQKHNLANKLAEQEKVLLKAEAEYKQNYSSLPEALAKQEQVFADLQTRELKLKLEREELNKQNQLSTDTQSKLHQCELALTEQKSALKLSNELLLNLAEQKASLQTKLLSTKGLLDVLQADIDNLAQNEIKWQSELASSEQAFTISKQKLQAKTDELKELENSNSGSFAKLNDIHALLSKLNAQLARLQSQVEKEELKRRQLLQELWENYSKSLNDLPAKLNPNYSPKKDEARIRDLRAQIKELGPVNVEAIEQYAELKERYDFIEGQRSDIIAGKKELDALIVQITEAMQSRFAESFNLIRENFQAIFVKLFGGGQGEILLDESADILTANIEIKACPPGKRMQNMLLLSGGERCLTAIALLFAIQELKPSAFCVLDEVEAALDDANIFRFTEFLQKQAEKTQFIIVTHRKSTMAACERIYGVTMQERGVSQVLTLALASDKAKFSQMIE